MRLKLLCQSLIFGLLATSCKAKLEGDVNQSAATGAVDRGQTTENTGSISSASTNKEIDSVETAASSTPEQSIIDSNNNEPLKLLNNLSNLQGGEKIAFDIQGGKPPYSLNIISGNGYIDLATMSITTNWRKEDISVEISDANANKIVTNFSIDNPVFNQQGVSGFGVVDYKISPDGKLIAYSFDNSGQQDLYIFKIEENNYFKVNPQLASGGNVSEFFFSYDSKYLIYLADQDTDEQYELFTYDIPNQTISKASDNLVNGGDVMFFRVSNISNKIVYAADQAVDDKYELYMVNVGSSTSLQLNANLVSGGNVFYDGSFVIANKPGGEQVVYIADQDIDNKFEIYSVSIDGGPVTRLNAASPAGTGVIAFYVSPNSQTIFYIAKEIQGARREWYAADIGGEHSSARLHPALGVFQDCYSTYFQITNDSNHALLFCETDPDDGYRVRLGSKGSSVAPIIHGDTLAGSPFKLNGDIIFTNDSSYIVYTNDEDTINIRELYSVEVANTANKIKLNTTQQNIIKMAAGANNDIFYLTSDFKIYKAQAEASGETLIGDYSYFNTNLSIYKFALNHDFSKIIIHGDTITDTVIEPIIIDVSNGNITRVIQDRLFPNNSTSEPDLLSDDRMIFRLDESGSGFFDLIGVGY